MCPPTVDTCYLSDGTLSCDFLSCFYNMLVENVSRLVDPINDRSDSSSKINLCPRSVDIYDLNDSSLLSDIGIDQLPFPCGTLLEGSCDVLIDLKLLVMLMKLIY